MARSTASRKGYAMRVCAPRTEARAAAIFSIESQKVTTGDANARRRDQTIGFMRFVLARDEFYST